MKKTTFCLFAVLSFCFFSLVCFSGCDFVYGILQKEGAQEKALLGEVIPNEYNEKVELLQKLLRIHGFSCGKSDGKLGPKVRDALAGFQEAKGLKVSRFAGKTTWRELNVFTETGLVKRGEVDLLTVQEVLSSQGFDPGKLDGKTGPKTKEAVKAFQEANNLKVDGKIGPQTLQKLNALFVDEE
ncbi:MAG: peptidoglycan-binding protein [Candidatus Aceula meridiana]|nr:peptidoglycan-binding protein [Candidatus Aceula meridiana]